VLPATYTLSARCRVTGWAVRGARKKGSLELSISVAPQDLAPRRLACLVDSIREAHRDIKRIRLLIFSSQVAAERYVSEIQLGDFPPSSNSGDSRFNDPVWQARQLHAIYSYDETSREHTLQMKPRGFDRAMPDDTVLQLPLQDRTHCHLELNGRCVLALDEIRYPEFAHMKQATGDVVLLGDVTRNGTLDHVRVEKSGSVPPGSETAFERAAIANVREWLLESGPAAVQFRLTYSFRLASTVRVDTTEMKCDLPNRVVITAHRRD
jgi:TonB family protein